MVDYREIVAGFLLLSPMNKISTDDFNKDNCWISQGHLITLCCVVNLVKLEIIVVGFVISVTCFGYLIAAWPVLGTRQLHVVKYGKNTLMFCNSIFWDCNRPCWIGSSSLLQVPESYVAVLKIQIYKLLPSVVSLVRNNYFHLIFAMLPK